MARVRRKLRHPHQATELSELSPGASYAFVVLVDSRWGRPEHQDYVMLGVVRDSFASILARGDRGETPEAFFDIPPGSHPGFVTVHMDGWFRFGSDPIPDDEPTLVYWDPAGLRTGWDDMESYLGETERPDAAMHCVAVPSAEWALDPRVHVVDWINPDDTVARAAPHWAGEEARLRGKRDRALRRLLGFDD